MSILDFPRINFSGVFWTNPCTANNDDVEPNIVLRDTNTLGPTLASKTDDEIWQYLREKIDLKDPGNPDKPEQTMLRSGWNLYGDHFCGFKDTTVTSFIGGPGASEMITDKNLDGIVGASVELLGTPSPNGKGNTAPVMVDLDPTGLISTQVFVGGILLKDGDTEIMRVTQDSCAYQNWLNFNSTVYKTFYNGEQNFTGIGTVMQMVFSAEALPDSASLPEISQGMKTLLDRCKQDGGMAVRFRMYEIQPEILDEDLYDIFQQGNSKANPAFGYLVGTLGSWKTIEPETETFGRKLTVAYPNRPSMDWASPDGSVKVTVPGAATLWNGPPAMIGNAVAQVNTERNVISLDLINCFPKYGYRDPDGPGKPTARGFSAPREKANVGQLELIVVDNNNNLLLEIGPVRYGYEDINDYLLYGGIVDIPFNSANLDVIRNNSLAIRGSTNSSLNAGTMLLQEVPYRIVTDDRTQYLTLNQAKELRVKVYERGAPITRAITLFPKEYKNIIQFIDNSDEPAETCEGETDYRTNQSTEFRAYEEQCDGNVPGDQNRKNRLGFPDSFTINPGEGYNDWFTFKINTVVPGAAILILQPENVVYGETSTFLVPGWSTVSYSTIRVFTNDDFSAIYAKGEITWDDVYNNVLRYYYNIYPAMSLIIPLNRSSSITSPYSAPLIRERLLKPDQPGFYSTTNMPITRSMSPNKVQLVLDYIAQEEKKQS